MIASFQAPGNFPVFKDLLNIISKGSERTLALSRPTALYLLTFIKSFLNYMPTHSKLFNCAFTQSTIAQCAIFKKLNFAI